MKMTTLFFNVTCALFVLTFSARAVAEDSMQIRWCATWPAGFSDSGYGEDYFSEPGINHRPASYAWATVRDVDDDTDVWEGNLDRYGCTPFLSLKGYNLYRLSQATMVSRGEREIYIQEAGTRTGTRTYRWYHTDYRTSGIPIFPASITHTSYIPWLSGHTNLSSVAGHILDRADVLRIPDSMFTTVKNDEHCVAAYFDGAETIFVDPSYNGVPLSNWKFIFAHEFGHRIEKEIGGPKTHVYDLPRDFPPHSYLCTCDHLTCGDDRCLIRKHCIQSLENTGAAQNEGWGHFFAAVTFNDRDPSSCSFPYYKDVMDEYGVHHRAPYPIDCADVDSRWVDTHCPFEDRDVGSERDWLVFLWALYNEGFEIEELSAIWNLVTTYDENVGETWDSLLAAVGSIYSTTSTEYDTFRSLGAAAGVDNYTP
ncbi:MAG: hypothetical protein GY854_03855 [Deltaproteobacteria bacterium]|nr:hypothetical protein [Deltaproteobacteria bacterium]